MAITEADDIGRARPADLSAVFALEQANLTAFPSLMLHFDGAWLTRLSPGNPARRVNSLNIYDPADDADIEARLARAGARFADTGIAMHLRWTPLVPPALDDFIDARGWERYAQTEVWAAALSESGLMHGMARPLADDYRMHRLPLADWLRDFAFVGGTGVEKVTPQALSALRASLEKVPAELLALSLRDGNGEPQAVLLGVCDGTLIGIFDVATRQDRRRRGLAAMLVTYALAYGRETGAKKAWLQVVADNAPARDLYRRFGFEPVYDYHYCRMPQAV
ncbi:acetyltransferase (GNAT) family protein [Breoghania corrubedonensis]|uniref:Acetyltransferase (GNAT) family protein n=1 Tax=Breoghania corrubedonensis TaxID=665038 RepID=A0A2T5V5W4_9HYPH|nr:GNAT family N-acetyltransferase [Breoghania corrubedonensis]PTW59147.1 acetyltransferase (GNAT) family protein [Breoghania corrubedonensis]